MEQFFVIDIFLFRFVVHRKQSDINGIFNLHTL